MKNKIVCLLLVLLYGFSFFACNKDEKKELEVNPKIEKVKSKSVVTEEDDVLKENPASDFRYTLTDDGAGVKITEYIGRIAPADKKALYMGYSFIPVFLGNILAGVISGPVFQNIADKVTLVKRFVTENGLSVDSNLSQSEFFNAAATQAGMTPNELTQHLWEIYTPSNMWMVVFAIGIFATIALFIYNQWLTRSERRAANLADSRH